MRSIRLASILMLFSCALAVIGCQHDASKTSQPNQAAASQTQASASQAQPANAPAQPADAQAQPAGPAQQPADAGDSGAAPAEPAQSAQNQPAVQAAQPVQAGESAAPAPRGPAQPYSQTAQNEPSQLTIPEGTPIEIRLVQAIGSARDASGETFAATLDAPIVVGNTVVVPRGVNVTGRVIYAKHSGRLKGPAELSVTLTSLEVGGQMYGIVTAHKSWKGRSHKRRNLAWIGGGAGAGSLVGVAAGGGIGAAIGAGVGAGGGTVTAFVTGRKNILLPSETRMRFVLRRPVTVQ